MPSLSRSAVPIPLSPSIKVFAIFLHLVSGSLHSCQSDRDVYGVIVQIDVAVPSSF